MIIIMIMKIIIILLLMNVLIISKMIETATSSALCLLRVNFKKNFA